MSINTEQLVLEERTKMVRVKDTRSDVFETGAGDGIRVR